MKKYLITGCGGFVAYHFMKYLDSINEGIKILGLDVNISDELKKNSFKNIEIQYFELDLLNYTAFENIIIDFIPTHVLHLASFSSVGESWKNPIRCFMNNTNIFLNLLEIIRKNDIKCRILSVGSSEEYGNVQENDIPLKESNRLDPISPYAIARVSQEMLSKCYVLSYKMEIVLTRSFNHIGPRQRDVFVVSSFVKQLTECKIRGIKEATIYTGDISIIRDFLDVRDVVRAYYILLDEGISGELYNVCSGTGYTLHEIIKTVADLMGISIKVKIESEKIRPNDNRIIIGDNSKIKNAIHWVQKISLRESLKDVINYWENELSVISGTVI
ncbi:GDP-mannose 4,6-dehydratase [Spirochaetia bacterium]|nr:GDP-mannose 4,6-dehydratase [Spirochaetia bacterium]